MTECDAAAIEQLLRTVRDPSLNPDSREGQRQVLEEIRKVLGGGPYWWLNDSESVSRELRKLRGSALSSVPLVRMLAEHVAWHMHVQCGPEVGGKLAVNGNTGVRCAECGHEAELLEFYSTEEKRPRCPACESPLCPQPGGDAICVKCGKKSPVWTMRCLNGDPLCSTCLGEDKQSGSVVFAPNPPIFANAYSDR